MFNCVASRANAKANGEYCCYTLQMEKIFPPRFFDSMEYLPIHLPYEAMVGGPVQYQWMYPFERIFEDELVVENPNITKEEIERKTNNELAKWLNKYVFDQNNGVLDSRVKYLASSPF
ncbi:uncharacterized protein LOC129284986 [Prosopis cineraria]|uniref:uncharacterized protein LOC129284986 n=1 Tax=Prosopis cineraria TaxID=364024 RepID=UPI00240F51F1|nr:uncharacterized protein LOC129284986 [Prosopis cineraria]